MDLVDASALDTGDAGGEGGAGESVSPAPKTRQGARHIE